MKKTAIISKKIISVILALIVATVSLSTLALTAAAAKQTKDLIEGLDYVASVSDNAYGKTDSYGKFSDLSGGGVRYSVERLGGYYPYVYNKDLGAFPGNGLMLQFSRYNSFSSSPKILGTGMFLVMLCKSISEASYYKFKTGVCGILIDTNKGEAQLVESTSDGMQSYDVKQVVIKSDILKQSTFFSNDFALYFRKTEANDIVLTITVKDLSASGIIERGVFNSIQHHPTDKTYVSFGSPDNNGTEWNEWTVDFYGAKHLKSTVSQGEHSTAYSNGCVAPNDKNITYYGRWNTSSKSAKSYFQSGFNVKFTGSSIVIASDGNLVMSVDGDTYKQYTTDGAAVSVDGLESGTHTLKVITEKSTNIGGLYIEPGKSLYPAGENGNILFVGDNSISASLAGSYAVKVAKKLNMDFSAVAYNGISVLPGEGSDSLGMPDRFYKLGEKGSGAQNENYNTAGYTPDCIVVNVGAYGTNGKTQGAYESFVKKLRQSYPKAQIICVEPFNSHNAAQMQSAVKAVQSAGDKNIFFVASSGWDLKLNSDNASLTADAQKTAATKLASKISGIINGNVTVNSGKADSPSTKAEKNKKASSKNKKSADVSNDGAQDENDENIEVVEETVQNKDSSVPVYLWIILAIVVVLVIAGVLLVVFWPKLKALSANKNESDSEDD